MRNKHRLSAIAMASVVAVLMPGCDKLPSSPQPSAKQAEDADGWRQDTHLSNIDGTVTVASKRVQAGNAVFALIADCKGNDWSFRIEAYDSLGEGMPFATKVQTQSFFGVSHVENVPTGRIKMQGIPVASLGSHFTTGSHLNVIELEKGTIATAYAQANGMARSFNDRHWNRAAVMKALLPFTVEVNTPNGTDELTFDRVPVILDVLDRCGGTRPLFDGEEATAQPASAQVPTPAPATIPPLPPASMDGDYAVSFGAYASRADADAVIAALRTYNLPGFQQQATISGRQAWRVRVGPYATREHAERARDAARRVRNDVKLEIVTLAEAAESVPLPTGGTHLLSGMPAAAPTPPADSAATVLSSPPPRYPPTAFRNGITGTVKVGLDIDDTGRVTAVDVRHSSGNKDLDAAALEAARRWRFNPAIENGVAVASRIEMPIDFALQ